MTVEPVAVIGRLATGRLSEAVVGGASVLAAVTIATRGEVLIGGQDNDMSGRFVLMLGMLGIESLVSRRP
jgi:hypothetical protein